MAMLVIGDYMHTCAQVAIERVAHKLWAINESKHEARC